MIYRSKLVGLVCTTIGLLQISTVLSAASGRQPAYIVGSAGLLVVVGVALIIVRDDRCQEKLNDLARYIERCCGIRRDWRQQPNGTRQNGLPDRRKKPQ
jgi:hypothetical protein